MAQEKYGQQGTSLPFQPMQADLKAQKAIL